MTTDFRHQGKRLPHSPRIAGVALLIMLFGALLLAVGCGHGPTAPTETAVRCCGCIDTVWVDTLPRTP